MQFVLVALAGAAGAATRHALNLAVGQRGFPWVTLAINLSGSFLLALLVWGPPGARLSEPVQAALGAGFLGAYTTFSTFSVETVSLVRAGRVASAAAYVAVSVLGGLAAAALGYVIGQALTPRAA